MHNLVSCTYYHHDTCAVSFAMILFVTYVSKLSFVYNVEAVPVRVPIPPMDDA